MIRIKQIATMLALIGSFGAAVASEALQATDLAAEHKIDHTSVNFQKDEIEFMGDNKLANIQGTNYKLAFKHFYCAFKHPDSPSYGKKVRHCIRHFHPDTTN